ncbi:MAG: type II secretion system major pseudopilin GspG [Myxococcota bacterium]|nr:type II secretion system protein GspG [Myxococcales bacterium]MBF94871.1 type II secretion system protein GspG [Myxococcales bacterium]MEC7751130.1 type II secretion system major pseudopilin GspG [Myxococcota bacterium]HBU47921.1 type II secretion system protein GspG [Myxococcales bacterium]
MTSTEAKKRQHRRRGMTLIEIMVVVAILGILATAITMGVMGQLDDAKVQTARLKANEIAKAMDLYKIRNNGYPSTGEGINALVNPGKGQPLFDELPVDPWDNPYNYANPGTRNSRRFDVWSNGPDGESGTADDVGNWKEE